MKARLSFRALLLRAFGLLLMLTALALPLAQAPDRPVESLVARWALPPSQFIEVKGQLVHMRDEGPRADPAPLVLIHGTGASLHTWDGWVAALKGTHRVIRFDLPGFGLTGPFTGAQGSAYPADDYTDVTLARFTLDLIDSLGIKQFSLAGNSLGGEVSWRVALLAPKRAKHLVLLDSAGYAFEPFEVPRGLLLTALPVLSAISEVILPRAAVENSLHRVYGRPDRVSAAQVDRYYELTLREGNRHALRQRFAQLHMGEGAGLIPGLRLPTLVIWGAEDHLIPPESGRAFARDIPGSRLVMLDGVGHVPQEEDPARSVAVARGFLEEHGAP
jgi:pimeloyl-ACP methyl ester carboxylesterase